jgi:DNA-binding transcriptional MerR regulator
MNVGELAAATGVSVRSIHHYESVGLLQPGRQGNGYRDFGDDDVRRVNLIRRFKSVGFSLSEVRDLAPCWRDGHSLVDRHDGEMRLMYEAKLAEISLQVEALAIVRQEIEKRLDALSAANPHTLES